MKPRFAFLLAAVLTVFGSAREAAASTFTVNISDASLISLLSQSYNELEYHTGANTYSFSGESTYVKVKGTVAETPFYSVTLNGSSKDVTMNTIKSGQPVTYIIEPVTDGSVIDIVVVNDAALTVTVTAPEGFIRAYSFNSDDESTDLSAYAAGALTLEAPTTPYTFTFKGNVSDYTVDSWSVNGVTQTKGFYGTKTFSAQQENLNLTFRVTKKTAYIHPVIDVDNADRIVATLDGATLDLVDGSNTLTIPEDGVNNKKLVVKAADSKYYIKSVTDNFGNTYSPYYGSYSVSLTKDMVLTIVTSVVAYDQTAVFYVNTDECFSGNGTFSSFSFSNDEFVSAFGTGGRPTSHYTEFKFAEAYPNYVLSWYSSKYAGLDPVTWDEYYYAWVYVNDEPLKSKFGTYNASAYNITLSDGDVVKAFFQENEPQTHTVTIVGGEMAEIVKDLITPVTATSFSALPGTAISITNVSAKSVEVNGVNMSFDAEGKLDVNVESADMVIKILGSSALLEEQWAEDTHFDICNLQGCIVRRYATEKDLQALPAGLYIVNGRKVLRH